MGDDDRRRRYPVEDRISHLPDDLLQDILVRLRSARAAARTSALSRRWRRVWAGVPELILDGNDLDVPPASFLDVVDAALDAHAAPTVQRLLIAVGDDDAVAITSARAASWLRFAAEHVAGTLSLLVPQGQDQDQWWSSSSLLPVELPVCGRAKRITLQLRDTWRLRLPPAGVFSALTALTILFGRVEGGELTAMVSTQQCPCLRELKLSVSLVHRSNVSIQSDMLRLMQLCICNAWQVDVIAPRLEKLGVYDTFIGSISAPKLSELFWTGGNCRLGCLRFDVVSRRLRLLEIVGLRSVTKSLLQQFDEVDDLKLFMSIPREAEGYRSFLNQINKLPVCKILNISLLDFNHHRLAPTLLHLLNTCNTTTKEVYVQLIPHDYQQQYFCLSSCPCRLPESESVDVITLNSLEEITICSHSKSYEELEFVQQLSKCNATSLKKLLTVHDNGMFRVHVESNEVTEKIRGLFPSNVKVELYVIRHGNGSLSIEGP